MNEDLFDDLEAVTKPFKLSKSLSFLLISDAGIVEFRGILFDEVREADIIRNPQYKRKQKSRLNTVIFKRNTVPMCFKERYLLSPVSS